MRKVKKGKDKTQVTETPKPESASAESLTRLEERIERVPITDEQGRGRMTAAAAMIRAARARAVEAAALADRAKAKKKAAEAKHGEADQVILDAQHGTMVSPYPVLVERHPTHPAE